MGRIASENCVDEAASIYHQGLQYCAYIIPVCATLPISFGRLATYFISSMHAVSDAEQPRTDGGDGRKAVRVPGLYFRVKEEVACCSVSSAIAVVIVDLRAKCRDK